jgi:hypothetical protein
MGGIQPVRTRYRGTWFASTLEADWAATFDALGWAWQYEPEAYKLPGGTAYRPDFYLPAQRVWAEAKGPHNLRLDKASAMQRALGYDEWDWATHLVVILRAPGAGDGAQWHGTRDDQDVVVVRCPDCEHCGFMDYAGAWQCRRHTTTGSRKFWQEEGGQLYRSGELAFTRAPRPKRRAG